MIVFYHVGSIFLVVDSLAGCFHTMIFLKISGLIFSCEMEYDYEMAETARCLHDARFALAVGAAPHAST